MFGTKQEILLQAGVPKHELDRVREAAIHHSLDEGQVLDGTPSEVLKGAFPWKDSPQGQKFWVSVCKDLEGWGQDGDARRFLTPPSVTNARSLTNKELRDRLTWLLYQSEEPVLAVDRGTLVELDKLLEAVSWQLSDQPEGCTFEDLSR